jgi:uncharacterized RDD family membrane protein YckC
LIFPIIIFILIKKDLKLKKAWIVFLIITPTIHYVIRNIIIAHIMRTPFPEDFDVVLFFKIVNIADIMILLPIIIYYVFILRITIGYWKKATSYGKSRLKMRIINKHTSKKLSFGYMILRETIAQYISAIPFYLGYLWIIFDKDRQGWHDKMCSSVVLKDKDYFEDNI